MEAEKIAQELRDGLEGVTPGPWVVRETTIHGTSYGGHWLELADPDGMIQMSGSGGARSYTMRVIDQQDHDDNEVNMRHFALCSPDRIAALLDDRDRLKARVEELERPGYVWVPAEPTREMWAAGGNAAVGKTSVHHDIVIDAVYSAILPAAPAKEEDHG